jgi:hypothetical protein
MRNVDLARGQTLLDVWGRSPQGRASQSSGRPQSIVCASSSSPKSFDGTLWMGEGI